MKNRLLYPFVFVLSLSLLCCGQEKTDKKPVLAKINDYELTLEEFEDRLVEDLRLNEDYKVTEEAKKELLEQLIRKELLIQEAKKMDLDRKDDFVKTIERYWESTLIRNLMELKGQKIVKRVYVSQEEIEKRYKEMEKSAQDIAPPDEIRRKIAEQIKEAKKRERLKEWIEELRKDAEVEINEKLLKGSK